MDAEFIFRLLIFIGFPLLLLIILVCTWISYFNPSLGWLDIFRPMRRAVMRRYQEDWDWARDDVRRRRGQDTKDGEDDRDNLPPGVWFPKRAHRTRAQKKP